MESEIDPISSAVAILKVPNTNNIFAFVRNPNYASNTRKETSYEIQIGGKIEEAIDRKPTEIETLCAILEREIFEECGFKPGNCFKDILLLRKTNYSHIKLKVQSDANRVQHIFLFDAPQEFVDQWQSLDLAMKKRASDPETVALTSNTGIDIIPLLPIVEYAVNNFKGDSPVKYPIRPYNRFSLQEFRRLQIL